MNPPGNREAIAIILRAVAQALKPQHEKQRPRWWWLGQRDPIARFTLWLVISTGAVFIATAVAVLVGAFQWAALKEANRDNRKAFAAAQRAFIYFEPPDTEFHADQAYQWIILAKFGNSGNTPARNVNYKVTCSDDGWDETALNRVSNAAISVGPKVTLRPTACSVTQAGLEQYTSASKKIIVIGRIEYRDIIGPEILHKTEMCIAIQPVSPKSTNFAALSTPCAKHNCADEECDE
jgi:hypothetical protein